MNESIDRELADWLHEGPDSGPLDGLERALAATRRVGQRPGWTLPERWLPMDMTMAWTRSQRPILAIVMVALLVVAFVATALFVGSSQRRLPPPFGPARNGAIVFERDGDLFIADAVNGRERPLVAGPEHDWHPVFSNQGDRIAFARNAEGRAQEGAIATWELELMTVRPDGSGLSSLGTFSRYGSLGTDGGFRWSPDGSALLVLFWGRGRGLAVVQADGSGSREAFNGARSSSWRPDGQHIVFASDRGDTGRAGAFLADADLTNVRRLPIDIPGAGRFYDLDWSPNGKHLSFVDSDSYEMNIADVDDDGNLTDWRRLDPDPDSNTGAPAWSPDSSQLSFLLSNDDVQQVAIGEPDGSGLRRVGPMLKGEGVWLDHSWSPDGTTLLITEIKDRSMDDPAMADKAGRFVAGLTWSVDLASGKTTEVQTPVETWQRLAP